LVSLAGEYIACQIDPKTGKCITNTEKKVTYEGLVPCGKEVTVNGEKMVIHCQFCHFFVMAKGILDFVLKMVFVVAVLMIVIAGIMYIIAPIGEEAGIPKLFPQAKGIITAVVIGLVIIFGAWIFVNTFFMLIGVQEWTGLREWFKINCPIELPK